MGQKKKGTMGVFDVFFNQNNDINHVDPATFSKMISDEPDAVILDVRTKDEYSSFRIPKSVVIDIYNSDFFNKIDQLDRSKTYLVYCASGSRSVSACKQMKKMGFEKVYNLKTGILGWRGEIEQG